LAISAFSSQEFTSLLAELDKLRIAFVRLFYPANCIFCRQGLDLEERSHACTSCIAQMPVLKQPLCAKCSVELAPYGPPRHLCNRCLREKTHYEKGVSIFRYEARAKQLIQRIKFGKKSWYLKAVRSHLRSVETPLPFSSYDFVVPVPLERMKKREREFNQSRLIAALLKSEKRASLPIRDIIQKIKKTKPQSALHREERLQNLENAFRLKRGAQIKQKKILLVDDVMTTGATANECAKCLMEGGALRVDVLSLSRTVHH